MTSISSQLSAQSTNTGNGVFYPHTRNTPQGKLLDAIITGAEAKPLPGGLIQVKNFVLKGIRDGQTNLVQVIAQAPECTVDYREKTEFVSSPGIIQIFTPTTNLYVQGAGFFCAESNQILFISNNVETHVAKSLLRSGVLPAPKAGDTVDPSQLLRIFSDTGQFNYRSNLVNYSGNVRVADPQFQMLSPFLSVQFASNQTVENILAWQGVTLTLTNKGTATGDTASYLDTNGAELLVLDGNAKWRNGDQDASASKFTYDPNRHFLIAQDQVRARWPNKTSTPAAPLTFRNLSAQHATLQMSTNGETVDAFNADGDVITVNEADHSRAAADSAAYDRTNDSLLLRGNSIWQNEKMTIKGDLLSVNSISSNQIFHSQGNAQFKLQLNGQSTNRWIYIDADDITHETVNAQTNLATFRGNVHGRLMLGDQLQDSLTSQLLLVYLNSSNQVETVVARGDIHAETAPDANGVKKILTSGILTARHSAVSDLWKSVRAEENVAIKLSGGADAADDQLTAAIVTAYFSAVTNQIESAVASGNVVFDQNKAGKHTHAVGERAVYDLAPVEQINLTGHPLAQKDKIMISGADRLIWDVKSGTVNASGSYHIIPDHSTAASNATTSAAP